MAAGNAYMTKALNPLVTVMTNEQIEAEYRARREAETVFVLHIASHIRTCFVEAERHRTLTNVTDALLDCQRRRKGEYDTKTLEAIRRLGVSETYFNITKTKCASAEAWLLDVSAPVQDKPWALEPTPVPDLPDPVKTNIVQAAVLEFRERALATGQPPTPAEVQAFTQRVYDEALKLERDEAKRRIERMERLVEDQLIEGEFTAALRQFIYYFATYKAAFLKGPILRRRRLPKWTNGRLEIESQDVYCWEAPNPHNVFPAPNARTIQESYLCEWISLDAVSLQEMRGAEGWNAEAINAVLRDIGVWGSGITRDFLNGEAERATLENRDTQLNHGAAPNTVYGVHYWGPIQRRYLEEWRGNRLAEDDPQAYEFVQVEAILIGRHVVKAVENPHPLGSRPYYASSCEKVPESVWGEALPEMMRDCQDPLNAALRNMIDNLGFASRPMVAVDINAAAAGADIENMYPGKIWYYDGSKLPTGSRAAVDFFQPDANIQELTTVADYFDMKADERTRIPRYTHGESDVGGAGETASGLSMLMSAAAKGIRRLIGFIDEDIIRPAVHAQYMWNMLFHSDPNVKGDARVRPRGVLALLVKEQTQLRRQEFLDRTNNPNDMMIIGVRGRAAVLRAVAQGLDLPVDDIVPPDDVLMQQVEASMAAQAAQAAPTTEKRAVA